MSTCLVTLIQSQLHWEDKAANLAMFSQKLAAQNLSGHIVVLPEMFGTGFSMRPQLLAEKMEGPSVRWMLDEAARHRCILCGSLMIEDGGRFYNRLIWAQPDGQMAWYDKRHLFAYAGENEHYSPGKRRVIVSVNGLRFHLQICYDLRFPVWARQQQQAGQAEYDVLLYVANWPEKRILAWRSLLVARAIENQCYVVAVNRVGTDGNGIEYPGSSMVVNALGDVMFEKNGGEVVATLPLHKEHLDELRTKMPFLRDGDGFWIR
jgi:predicted amidohydrolase